MSSKKKDEVIEETPIGWGWLGILFLAFVVLGWFGGSSWWLSKHPSSTYGNLLLREILFSAIALGCLSLTGTTGKVWNFVCAYWHRNVRGRVANFTLNGDKVEVWIQRELHGYGWTTGALVWRVPLGGWFKKRPQLLMFFGSDCLRKGWQNPGWNFLHCGAEWYWYLKEPDTARVRIKDREGNILSAFLPSALRYVGAHTQGDLRSMFMECETLKKFFALHERVTQSIMKLVLEVPKRYPRFANSAGGREFLQEIGAHFTPTIFADCTKSTRTIF